MTKKPFVCAFCKKSDTYTPKDENEPSPDNMICDECFKKEAAALDAVAVFSQMAGGGRK